MLSLDILNYIQLLFFSVFIWWLKLNSLCTASVVDKSPAYRWTLYHGISVNMKSWSNNKCELMRN